MYKHYIEYNIKPTDNARIWEEYYIFARCKEFCSKFTRKNATHMHDVQTTDEMLITDCDKIIW